MKDEEKNKANHKKQSYLLSLFLTLFLGPLGLLYNSVIASLAAVALMYSGFSELYFYVSSERHILDAYLRSKEYLSTLGELGVYWIACTPVGLIIVFFINRRVPKLTNRQSSQHE